MSWVCLEKVVTATWMPFSRQCRIKHWKDGRTWGTKDSALCFHRPPVWISAMVLSKSRATNWILLVSVFSTMLSQDMEPSWCLAVVVWDRWFFRRCLWECSCWWWWCGCLGEAWEGAIWAEYSDSGVFRKLSSRQAARVMARQIVKVRRFSEEASKARGLVRTDLGSSPPLSLSSGFG